MTMRPHVDEDHVIPEPQLLEALRGLMVAVETMDGELRFAARSRVTDGLCGFSARHVNQHPICRDGFRLVRLSCRTPAVQYSSCRIAKLITNLSRGLLKCWPVCSGAFAGRSEPVPSRPASSCLVSLRSHPYAALQRCA
jgi:hypothetical protein